MINKFKEFIKLPYVRMGIVLALAVAPAMAQVGGDDMIGSAFSKWINLLVAWAPRIVILLIAGFIIKAGATRRMDGGLIVAIVCVVLLAIQQVGTYFQ